MAEDPDGAGPNTLDELEMGATVDFVPPPSASAPAGFASRRAGITDEFDTRVTDEQHGRYLIGTPGADEPTEPELGRGGIGRVLIAHDSHLGREIAVKELLADHDRVRSGGSTGASIAVATRFLREARVTGQLEHPSIVPVYELGRRQNGALY